MIRLQIKYLLLLLSETIPYKYWLFPFQFMVKNWSHLKSNNRTTCYFNFLLEEKVLINNLFSGAHLDILIKWHFSECKNIILLSTEAEMAKLGKVWSFLCHLKFSFKQISHKNKDFLDFPGCTVDKNPPANAGDGVWSLIGEDPTCLGTTKPVGHNYWTCACRACALHRRSHRKETPVHHNRE